MPRVTVDFSEVEAYEPLPPGEYPVVIDSIEMRQSENSEHPYLNFTLKVAEGEYKNRNIWFIGSLSPKALFRLQAVFASFGLTEATVDLEVDDGTGTLLSPQLIGLPAIARCRNEVYQGNLRTRVDELVGIADQAPVPAAAPAAGARKSPFAPRAADTEAKRAFK